MIVSANNVSDRFKAAVTKSHQMVATCRVLREGSVIHEFSPSTGGVDLDATAEIRGRFDLAVNNEDLVPKAVDALLAPYGNQIQIARGIRYAPGDEELVSLGVFRIDESDSEDSGEDLNITVGGQDRSTIVSDAKFEDPYQIDVGTLATDAILALVQYAIPDVTYSFSSTGTVLPKLIDEEGGDRWEMATGIAKAIGGELYFDGVGDLVLRPVASPADNYSRLLVEGDGGLLVQASKGWSRVDSFNRVIVTGNNTGLSGTIPRGVATDDNPLSPTYYGGSYGKVPRFESSEFITTDEQAQDMAEGILAKEIGATQFIDFGSVVDPSFSASKIVQITRERLGINESHVIDTLSIPLTAEETMTGRTRSVQI